MTKSQADILASFRKQVFEDGILRPGDSIGSDDETLLRFLRARKFDLKDAKKMLKNCQEWRRTVEGVGIDELYRRLDPFDYPEREAVFECWPMWYHKTDKQGRPLNIHFFGGMDLPKLHKVCTPERHWQSVLVNCESVPREILPAASRAAGKPIGTVFTIIDLKGFGLPQFIQMKSLVKHSFKISQDYYPETMGQLAVINAPPTFTIIWAIAKQWLSKDTVEKVHIFGSDYKEYLLQLVDAENLPSVLGGTCECKDHGGCHRSMAGPWMSGRVGWGKNTPPSISPEQIREAAEREAAEKARKEEAERLKKEAAEKQKKEAAEKREKDRKEKKEREAAEKLRKEEEKLRKEEEKLKKEAMTPKKEVSDEKAAVLGEKQEVTSGGAGEKKEPTKSLESDRWEIVSSEQGLPKAAESVEAQVLATGHADEAQVAALAAQILATDTPEPTEPTTPVEEPSSETKELANQTRELVSGLQGANPTPSVEEKQEVAKDKTEVVVVNGILPQEKVETYPEPQEPSEVLVVEKVVVAVAAMPELPAEPQKSTSGEPVPEVALANGVAVVDKPVLTNGVHEGAAPEVQKSTNEQEPAIKKQGLVSGPQESVGNGEA